MSGYQAEFPAVKCLVCSAFKKSISKYIDNLQAQQTERCAYHCPLSEPPPLQCWLCLCTYPFIYSGSAEGHIMIPEFLSARVIVYPAETAFLFLHICPMMQQNKTVRAPFPA